VHRAVTFNRSCVPRVFSVYDLLAQHVSGAENGAERAENGVSGAESGLNRPLKVRSHKHCVDLVTDILR